MTWQLRVLLLIWVVCLIGLVPGCATKGPSAVVTRAAILENLVVITEGLTHLQGKPEFRYMTAQQLKEDACVRPEACPAYVSVRPPGADYIIINTDVDLARDINAQGQIVHVLALYQMEKAGEYSSDMPCSLSAQKSAYANIVRLAFMDVVQQQRGVSVQTDAYVQVHNICRSEPPPIKGQF
jgi:hypothetical protein